LDQKIKKDSLLTVRDPYVKKVSFEGFTYKSVQAFDFSKIWADRKNFTQEDFNPNTVYNEAFEKWKISDFMCVHYLCLSNKKLDKSTFIFHSFHQFQKCKHKISNYINVKIPNESLQEKAKWDDFFEYAYSK